MPDCVALAVFVHMRLEVGLTNLKIVVQEFDHAQCGRLQAGADLRIFLIDAILHSQNLYAVAGRQDQRFANSWLMGQRARRVGEPMPRDRQPLAHRNGGGGVVHPQQQQLAVVRRRRQGGIDGKVARKVAHGVLNLCTAESEFAAHTPTITRNTKHDKYTARRPRNPLLLRI